MRILPLLAVLAAPASAFASDVCAPHAALLGIVWSFSYERADGPSRAATLDKSECSGVSSDSGVRDFDDAHLPAIPSAPEPRLRFWSENSPYELRLDVFNGRAELWLMKRVDRYQRVMAYVDRIELSELAGTSIDFSGDVVDDEYPMLRVGRGTRKIVRAARVVLTPRAR